MRLFTRYSKTRSNELHNKSTKRLKNTLERLVLSSYCIKKNQETSKTDLIEAPIRV